MLPSWRTVFFLLSLIKGAYHFCEAACFRCLSALLLHDLGIAAKVGELIQRDVQFLNQFFKGGGADGTFQIKIEHEFKITAGQGTALQLDEVDALGIEPAQQLIEGTGTVRENEHQGSMIRTGIDLRLFRDADEPGVVVAVVLDFGRQALQAVEGSAVTGGDCGGVFPSALGDHLGGGSGVPDRIRAVR